MEWLIVTLITVFLLILVFAEVTIVPLIRLMVPRLRYRDQLTHIAELDHELFDHYSHSSIYLNGCDYCKEIKSGVR